MLKEVELASVNKWGRLESSFSPPPPPLLLLPSSSLPSSSSPPPPPPPLLLLLPSSSPPPPPSGCSGNTAVCHKKSDGSYHDLAFASTQTITINCENILYHNVCLSIVYTEYACSLCVQHVHVQYICNYMYRNLGKIRSVQYFEQTFFVRKLEIWNIRTFGKIKISDTWPQYVEA